MRIYIDEAGNFVNLPKPSKSSFSLVLALIIPSTSEEELFFEFLRLRDSWPEQKIEIKGSTLEETQAAQLINLLARFDVVAEFVTVDMGAQTVAVIEDLKNRQADAVVAHLTADHHPELIHQLEGVAKKIRGMADQLFLQAFLTIELVVRVVQVATLYYVQRASVELGDIAWFIDRKQRSVTEMEEVWSLLILPAGEYHFAKTPLVALSGADYSHFNRRYEVQLPDAELERHLNWMDTTYGARERSADRVNDAKRILTEQQNFVDSLDYLGIQLADMLASILRRALNDRLQLSGWKDFGKLLVGKAKNKSSFLSFGNRPSILQGHAAKVGRALESKAKNMIDSSAR
jgi:hypothetical protein